jgi:hypothetical protein
MEHVGHAWWGRGRRRARLRSRTFPQLSGSLVIAGGYAIELAAWRSIREHSEVDILLLRRDQLAVKPKDETDFTAALPMLTKAQREWLRDGAIVNTCGSAVFFRGWLACWSSGHRGRWVMTTARTARRSAARRGMRQAGRAGYLGRSARCR